jgi:hypothetical protein
MLETVKQRLPSPPAWVIVLGTAAVVGSISAVASVTAIARVRNRQPVAEVPVREVTDQRTANTSESYTE